jgi:hypothetical protein
VSSVKGIDQLLARLDAIGEPQPFLRVWQLKTVEEAQREVHRKTGFLQRNIRPGQITGTHATVVARTPYAASLEYGAKRHRIPKIGNARRPMPIGGARRLSGRLRKGAKPEGFAWHVDHPGNKPYPYLIPGARNALRFVKDVVVDLWNRAA